jgi:hypothetical protein
MILDVDGIVKAKIENEMEMKSISKKFGGGFKLSHFL